MNNNAMRKRYPMIDIFRFVAIVLMVIFHIAFDLNIFRYVDINFQKDAFWFWLPRLIVFLFMICVGIGLCLSNQKEIKWDKVKKRFIKISSFAILITIFTYFAFPKNWIYFGTLHCIAISSILGLAFIRYPKISLCIGLGMQVLYWPLKLRFTPLGNKLGIISMDYIPLYPWLGIALIGIYLYHVKFHEIEIPSYPGENFVRYCSEKSLWIYLLHQPIIYSIVWAYYTLTT